MHFRRPHQQRVSIHRSALAVGAENDENGKGRENGKPRKGPLGSVACRKRLWNAVGIVGICACVDVFAYVLFQQGVHRVGGLLQDPVFSYPSFVASMVVTGKSDSVDRAPSHTLTNEYGRGRTSGERRKPLANRWTAEEKLMVAGMKRDFETLNSTGKLLPCRLDEGNACFDDSARHRVLLYNPLAEGTRCEKPRVVCFSE